MSRHRLELAAPFSELPIMYTSGESTNVRFQTSEAKAAAWAASNDETQRVLANLLSVQTVSLEAFTQNFDRQVERSMTGVLSGKVELVDVPAEQLLSQEDVYYNPADWMDMGDAAVYARLATRDYQPSFNRDTGQPYQYYEPYLFTHHGETPTGAYVNHTVSSSTSAELGASIPAPMGRHHFIEPTCELTAAVVHG